jgi:hemerythrin superfamily protein
MAKDAVALIKADHRKVEKLFKEFERTGGEKRKQDLVYEICTELEAHARIEEEIFYPAVASKVKKSEEEMIKEAVEEHHLVKVTIGELRQMRSSDPQFDAKVTVLIENVRHHVEEEEQEMLPEAEEVLGEGRLAELGEKVMERKRQLGVA